MEDQEQYRILFLFPRLNSYGVAKSMLALAQGLLARGHKVYCASDAEPEVVEDWVSKGVHYIPAPFKAMTRSPMAACSAAVRLAQTVRQERLHLVHSHHRQTSLLLRLMRPWVPCPVVTTCHGVLQGRKSLSFWGDRVICVSADTRRNIVERFGVQPRKAIVIHNGIDIAPWRNLRSSGTGVPLNKPGDALTVTNLAKLSPEKDQATLLKAMPLILEKFPRARLRLVGTGVLETDLKQLAQEVGVAEAVDFVGLVRDVRPILAQTDVFVLCSTTEGLPMSLLEAMAAGVPAVVTGVGGMPMLVRHRETGCVVPVGDCRRLAEEICFLLSNPQKAQVLGLKGQEWVVREFSTERMAKEVEAVYRGALNEWDAR